MEENYSLEDRWKLLENELAKKFDKVPNLEAILFLIGINEYQGRTPKYKFSKQEKQDLMHVGTCTLLQQFGYYRLSHYDDDGWPHFEKLMDLHALNLSQQEQLMKTAILSYFDELW